MSGIGVGYAAGFVVIESEKERGVLFRLGACIEVAIQEPEHLSRRRMRQTRSHGGGSRPGFIGGYSSQRHELLLPVGADGGMNRSHEQRRRDSFAADIAKGDADLVGSVEQEIVI